MMIEVRRFHYADTFTVGKLHINGKYLCYTLEDKVREIENKAVRDWKVYGETAIPMGIYGLAVTMSPRFKKILPLLLNVPGFEGVRIHTGNTPIETDGCILVGMGWDGKSDFISNSRDAFNKLMTAIGNCREDVNISIMDNREESPAVLSK